jgi:acetylornithine deacetylase
MPGKMKIPFEDILSLFTSLVSTPSPSGEESRTADQLQFFFLKRSIPVMRVFNNLIVRNRFYNKGKKTILLNSHHDTVKPGELWTRNPNEFSEKSGKFFGLGTNDAKGPLVALIAAFLELYDEENLSFNLMLIISAEEEISGKKGITLVLDEIGNMELGIVGEPTGMKMAVAEKGLMVLDCTSYGKEGHAAREEGENAIYKAIQDVEWFRTYRFEKESEWLGMVKMSVTVIRGGDIHNRVPGKCEFVVDIRSTDAYPHEEILEIIRKNIHSEIKERSVRLKPSHLPHDHKIIQVARKMGLDLYGSPTLSDQALIPGPTVKIGPGDPSRSHMADEYILKDELIDGIQTYIQLIKNIIT